MLLLATKDYLRRLKYFSDQVGKQSTTYTPYDSEKQKKAHKLTNCSKTDH